VGYLCKAGLFSKAKNDFKKQKKKENYLCPLIARASPGRPCADPCGKKPEPKLPIGMAQGERTTER
jgi:hypothetical protein